FAALLGGVAHRLSRRGRGARCAFQLAWITVAGIAVLWLPAALQPLGRWPLLVGLTVVVWAGVRRKATAAPVADSAVRKTPVPESVALVIALMATLTAWPARATAPEPITVLVTPG